MSFATRANPDKKEETLITIKISELEELISAIVKKECDHLLHVINELKTNSPKFKRKQH